MSMHKRIDSLRRELQSAHEDDHFQFTGPKMRALLTEILLSVHDAPWLPPQIKPAVDKVVVLKAHDDVLLVGTWDGGSWQTVRGNATDTNFRCWKHISTVGSL